MSLESGREYLRRIREQYEIARTTLPRLAEDEFEKVRRKSAGREIGTETFLMDFAIEDETRRRDIERWVTGRPIPSASAEHTAAVISALPSYTVVNPEAIGAMKIEQVRRFKIDIVTENIIAEIAQRLPRKIDAYRYHEGRASDALNIPGLGKVTVAMDETGNGIFSTIETVESKNFRIWNSRRSGVNYMNRYCDISFPSTITIKDAVGHLPQRAKTMEIKLYDDNSGIWVELDGKEFTNARVNKQKDYLYRTYSGPNEAAPDYQAVNRNWKEDKTVFSWEKIEENTIIWLVENVLNPLKKAPMPENQMTVLPEEEPFPKDKLGPLYTFIDEKTLIKIALIKDNPGKAYPDERKASGPTRMLLSLDMPRRDASEIAYNSFVWCGVGEINREIDIKNVKEIGLEHRRDDGSLHSQGVAVIRPKSATDAYVVDWQEWDNYRARVFTPTHAKLSNREFYDMHVAVARTLVPITKYDGSYKKPIVLIGRDLELNEVEGVYLPPQKRKL